MSKRFIRFLSLLLVLVLAVQMSGILEVTSLTAHAAEVPASVPVPETDANISASKTVAELTEEPAEIIGEEESLRTEDTKHFRMSDGSFTAVTYGHPVHYQDEDGQWQAISNVPIETTDASGKDKYLISNGNASISFAAILSDGHLITVSCEDKSVDMFLLDRNQAMSMSGKSPITAVASDLEISSYNRNATAQLEDSSTSVMTASEVTTEHNNDFLPENLSSCIFYEDVYPGIDIRYTAWSYHVKEEIIVKTLQDSYRYDFLLVLKGLTPRSNPDGSISLLDSDKKEIYLIPTPHMVDAAGATSNLVSYEMTEVESGLVLTVEADKAWIESEDRVLPISIDPTVTTRKLAPGHSASDHIYATYVNPVIQDSCYYYRGDLLTGYVSGYENPYITYLYFNKLPTLPVGSIISDAVVRLYVGSISRTVSMPIGMYKVTNGVPNSDVHSWFKSLTYNNKPEYNAQELVDFVEITSSTAGNYAVWDMTGLVKSWYEGATDRMVALAAMEAYNASSYVLQCYPNSGDYVCPVLTINYRNNYGLEDYYTYQSMSAGAAGNAYVSDSTGQLKVTKNLLGSSSQALPFSLNLIYNSDYFLNSTADYLPPSEMGLNVSVGSGWTLDCVQALSGETLGTVYYLKHRDGDGTVHYYKRLSSSSNYYYDEDGLNLTLRQVSDYSIRLEDRIGNYRVFRNNRLSEIVDSDGNKILISYTDNQITDITRQNDGGAKETLASFVYDGNLLTSVTDAAGNVYTLEYTDGKLTAVKKNGDYTARFGYTGYLIHQMTDCESGYTLNFTYDSGRVSGYSESVGSKAGAAVTVTYPGMGHTVYQDHGPDREANTEDDLLHNYLYDHAGRTFNIYVTDSNHQIFGAANGVYTENSTTGQTNNRILRSASTGVVAQQLMVDGGLEYSTWTHNGTSVSTDLTRTGLKALTGATAHNTDVQTAQKASESLKSGKIYTFSGYVNTSGMTFTGKGIYLKVTDSNGQSWSGTPVAHATAADFDGGWVRLSVTFTAETTGVHTLSICREGASGTFYADDFQLETGDAPSEYNMVENGQMNGADKWTIDGDGEIAEGTLSFDGAVSYDTNAYQDIPVNLSGAQTYVLSGWVKADTTPDTITSSADPAKDTHKQCGLRAMLTYSDGTTEYHYVPFNTDVTAWQFVSYAIIPKEPSKTVSTIRVSCAFERNVGTAVFDNISLIRETALSMTYDSEGNLLSTASTGMGTDVNTYSSSSQLLLKTVTAGYGTYTYTYNDANNKYRPSSMTRSGVTESYSYNTRGNLLSTTISASNSKKVVTSAIYSADGNLLISVTDAAGNTVSYAYGDANSTMLGLPISVTAPNGTVTNTAYDSDGRVTQTNVANAATLLYNYSNGNLSSITRTGGNSSQIYNLEYDSFGNTTSIEVGDRLLAIYEYESANGNLKKQTDGNGDTITYTYDNLGRVKTATYSDGLVLTYTYTGEGSLYSVTTEENNEVTTYIYNYDSLDRLIASERQDGETTVIRARQAYDNVNRVVYQAWQLGDTTYEEGYTYNSAIDGSLNTFTTATGQTLKMNYDGLRRLSKVTGGVYDKTYTYRDVDNTKTTMQVASVAYDLPTDQSFAYTYDNMGNIATYTDANGMVTYTYDAQGQLLSASDGTTTYSYMYDTVGNILEANGHSYTYDDPNWKDLLTAIDGETITYDASGNPTSYYNGTRWNFTWEQGRRLTTATNGTTSLSYTYDADGLRTSKTVDGVEHTYYYASGKLLRETYGSNTLDFFYDASGNAYALKYNGTIYYYITNLQGDVMSIVDGTGAVVASYEYDPYGNVLTASGTLAEVNPLRYRGYYYDGETGMYYLQSRYYDPDIGRFINADTFASTGQGLLGYNMFAYCINNPVIFADYQGNMAVHYSVSCLNDEGYVRHYGDGKAISMSIYNQSVYIDAYMTFNGDIDPDILIQGIKEYWEGTYTNGTYTYNFFISIHQGNSSNGYTVTVNSYDDNSRGYCMWNPIAWSMTKESTIHVSTDYYQSVSCGWTMAHEFGHSMGVLDYYTQSHLPGFNARYASIMNWPGVHANFYDIVKVIDANMYNSFQKWHCVGGL